MPNSHQLLVKRDMVAVKGTNDVNVERRGWFTNRCRISFALCDPPQYYGNYTKNDIELVTKPVSIPENRFT